MWSFAKPLWHFGLRLWHIIIIIDILHLFFLISAFVLSFSCSFSFYLVYSIFHAPSPILSLPFLTSLTPFCVCHFFSFISSSLFTPNIQTTVPVRFRSSFLHYSSYFYSLSLSLSFLFIVQWYWGQFLCDTWWTVCASGRGARHHGLLQSTGQQEISRKVCNPLLFLHVLLVFCINHNGKNCVNEKPQFHPPIP